MTDEQILAALRATLDREVAGGRRKEDLLWQVFSEWHLRLYGTPPARPRPRADYGDVIWNAWQRSAEIGDERMRTGRTFDFWHVGQYGCAAYTMPTFENRITDQARRAWLDAPKHIQPDVVCKLIDEVNGK